MVIITIIIIFYTLSHLSCEFRVHRAGLQLKTSFSPFVVLMRMNKGDKDSLLRQTVLPPEPSQFYFYHPPFSFLSGFLCPFVTAEITSACGSAEDCYEKWQLVFLIAASVHIFNIVFYVIFANGELQDWARASNEQKQILSENDQNTMDEDNMEGPTGDSSCRYGTN